MSCPEFQQNGICFFFGELSPQHRSAFERHLNQCSVCQEELHFMKETWDKAQAIPQEAPSQAIRDEILRQSRLRKETRSTLLHKIRTAMILRPAHPAPVWGAAFAGAIALVILLIVRPFDSVEENGNGVEQLLAWEDDFLAETQWIDSEIDRVEEGVLLTDYASIDDEASQEDAWLSPVSQDLNWIRGKVEDLMRTIYGI